MFRRSSTQPAEKQNPGIFQRLSVFCAGRPDQLFYSACAILSGVHFAGLFSFNLPELPLVCLINMDRRKRPLEAVVGAGESFKTPEKRVSKVRLPDSDYTRWGVRETCQYLRGEGLGEWEDTFRGLFHGFDSINAQFFYFTVGLNTASKLKAA